MSHMLPECSHLGSISVTDLPVTAEGCEDCLRDGDSTTGHALIRSLEPREEWSWCFVDEVALIIPEVTGHTRIPPSPMLA